MRQFIAIGILLLLVAGDLQPGVGEVLLKGDRQMLKMNNAKSREWISRWERNIITENPMRYCSIETGEALVENNAVSCGLYYGYLATGNSFGSTSLRLNSCIRAQGA